MRLVLSPLLLSTLLSAASAFAPAASFVHRSGSVSAAAGGARSATRLGVSIGLGPGEDEVAADEEAAAPSGDDDSAEIEEPDHELFRTSRLSKADEKCDEWFGSLLGAEDEEGQMNGMILGEISEEARRRILTLPELKREPVLTREDEEWTPYFSKPLPGSPILPAYGLEQFGLPVPRKNADAWRQFDVAGMVGQDYSGIAEGAGSDLEIDDATKERYVSSLAKSGAWMPDDDVAGRLVYVNGRFCPALSKETGIVRNLSGEDFASPDSVRDEIRGCLSRLTDGFTDELAAPVDDGDIQLTSNAKLSSPNHNVGDPQSQFAINSQHGSACFAALNTVRTGAVALVDVPDGHDEGVESPLPVLIVNARTSDGGAPHGVTEEDTAGVACHPRTLAIVGENSCVSIAQSCVDLDDSETDDGDEDAVGEEAARLFNGYTQVFVKAGANVTHAYIEETGGMVTPGVEGGFVEHGGQIDGSDARETESNRLSMRDTHLETIDVHVTGDEGTYRGTVMGMGGTGRSRVVHSVSLLRPGSHAEVNGFSLAGGAQRTEVRTNIHHIAQGTESRQTQRNMVGGRATSSFRGRIRVERSAQQTNSEQLSRTILLSDKARIWTVPSLEIIADDVQCAHGATVSDMSEEELFYLRSRGLGREVARNLLMYAFVDEVSSSIDKSIQGEYDDEFGLRSRCIERLQNLVPQGERAIMGEFQSV
eukprot:CAMPEP_0113570142 /NCGR_PEP_ID=MMETSP0015_2-20120614/24803_1 /TAXON_ID=2838 /ORGANISM="Odontella" /LENGTH=706 /DNA_ID=CAMNT_0000472887 /DNA_START=133 /DNA_END=2253 /DNA_ORIENTATION=- /assembly_acc=CAM_ASM_000160